jgi:O-antigen/teichoic acid export membrane protein
MYKLYYKKVKVILNRFKRLSKEGIWITAGQVMAMLGSLIGITVLSKAMTPAEYGQLALGMTAFTFVGQLIVGPLGNGVVRFYAPAVELGRLVDYLHAVVKLVVKSIQLIVLIGFIVGLILIISNKTDVFILFSLSFLFAILSGGNSLLNGIQNAARNRANASIHQGFESWIRFLAATCLMVLFGYESQIAMLGFCVSALIILTSQYYFFKKKLSFKTNEIINVEQWQRKITVFSMPFAIWGIFTWAQLASDRWALGAFSTSNDVGLYVVVYQLGYYPISMVAGVIVQLITPVIFQRAGNADDIARIENVSNIVWLLTLSAFIFTVISFLFTFLYHDAIFSILLDEEYRRVSYLLPWMILAGGIFSVGQIITINIMSQMNTPIMKTGKILTAVIGIALNCIGALLWGINGLVAGVVVFSFIHFIWFYRLFKQQNERIIKYYEKREDV